MKIYSCVFSCFIIFNLTYNEKYIYLPYILVSNTTFLIHQIQSFKNIPFLSSYMDTLSGPYIQQLDNTTSPSSDIIYLIAFVDISCSHDRLFVHLCNAIYYVLLLVWVTLQTLLMTMLDILVVIPISFIIYDANKVWCYSVTNQSQDLGEWFFIQIVP